jgi:hypothetical protein
MTNLEKFLASHNPNAMLDTKNAIIIGTDGSIVRVKDKHAFQCAYGSGYILGGTRVKIVVADHRTARKCERLIIDQFEKDRAQH